MEGKIAECYLSVIIGIYIFVFSSEKYSQMEVCLFSNHKNSLKINKILLIAE